MGLHSLNKKKKNSTLHIKLKPPLAHPSLSPHPFPEHITVAKSLAESLTDIPLRSMIQAEPEEVCSIPTRMSH